MLQPAVFTVDTQEAGSGEVLVYVEDPEGYKEEVITFDRLHHLDWSSCRLRLKTAQIKKRASIIRSLVDVFDSRCPLFARLR